jgi:uncharacterized membrane protein YdjX (TVP38/TMEM64 family)
MTRKNWTRLALVAGLGLAIGLFFAFDLHRVLTLAQLKASQRTLQTSYEQHALLSLASYFCLYTLMVAANLPGALIMSLAGAAIFGFWPALLTVSFASSLGATMACFVARHLFRDAIQRRFSGTLAKVDAGVREEGAFYLFSMRLIPVIPFFAINVVMGLTAMPLRTFYWVSQLGMLPGTAVYLNAGQEIGKLESLSGILSPSLLLSFALLGLFPLAAKKTLAWRKRKAAGA